MIAGINAIRPKNTAKWQIHRRTSYRTGLSINFMQWFYPEEPLLPDIRPHFRTGIKMQPEICNSCAETEKSIHAPFLHKADIQYIAKHKRELVMLFEGIYPSAKFITY